MEKLEGRIAYLPDGQKVRIERVSNGLATVRRVSGNRCDTIAVCAVERLTLNRQGLVQQGKSE
jgi:hypothetical protein